jgi:hypothetical protein
MRSSGRVSHELKMQLVYQLAGAGWADARISHNSSYRDMVVSYLSDGLGDMARAALQLLHGAREVSFSFQDEPGEHRWILSRGEADSLHIRILWFDDTFTSRPRERGAEVFTCDCVVLDFVGQLSYVLQSILADEGLEGYKLRWQNHEFPLDTFTELQRLLTPQ